MRSPNFGELVITDAGHLVPLGTEQSLPHLIHQHRPGLSVCMVALVPLIPCSITALLLLSSEN